ncbi:MAG: GNAT family N-acetyltransferase [Gemmatimonadaceae bacterium]
MVATEAEAREVFRLRHRVFVHEQGRRGEGIDPERGELRSKLDAFSHLWHARDGKTVVGTVTQTMICPHFDVALLPTGLELEPFRAEAGLVGYSSRFAIEPGHRGKWVLASLARHTYAHGRRLGAKFDFMTANPALVPLYERLGYVRYTASGIQVTGIGLLIPMVLSATDLAYLRTVRSACLPAAEHFAAEPEWGEWLRAAHPIIGRYYHADLRPERHVAHLERRFGLPVRLAEELGAMSFVHQFPAGTTLLREGDRVSCVFIALQGTLGAGRARDVDADERTPRRAGDGVAFARDAVRCATDAVVLCLPMMAVTRLQRRYPEYSGRLEELVGSSAS